MTSPNIRLHYIDWIRVLAFLLLIIFHCAVPFTKFPWEIKNAESSAFLDTVIMWLHQWRLPVIFFIAGVGVRFSLKKRSILQFMGERFVRLFIPLAFAMFFITPIQVYFEWLQEGTVSGSYFNFYPSVYEFVPYPDGTLTWSHMWFVAYLFVFTILLLPVFSLSKIRVLSKAKQKLNGLFKTPVLHVLLAAPFIAYYFAYYIEWPEQGSLIDDWFVFNSSITYYFFGFFLGNLPAFWETCKKYRRYFLAVVVVLAFFLIKDYYWDVTLPKEQDNRLYWYGVLDGFHIWFIICAVIGYSMKYLNFSNKYLTYLNTAVYPFYILHQTIIVASGYYVTQWNAPILVKFLALVVLCGLGIWSLYHFIIRKTKLTRVLFGLRLKRTQKPNPI